MSTATRLQKTSWLAGVSALVAFSGSSFATPLALQDVPLFISTGAEPNVMLMIDNSGSMENIVPETPYNAATTYLATCPSANQIAAGQRVDLALNSGNPRVRHSSTNYVWGTGSGQRCFISNQNYMAMLNTDGGGFLPAQYTGNYLNWYFDSTTTSGCSNNWSSGRKPCSRSRIMIARVAGANLVNSMPSAMRAGLSSYNGSDGGQLLETMGLLTSSKRSTLTTAVNALNASGNTPLAETLSDIGYYFSRGATNLTLHPAPPPPGVPSGTTQTVSRTSIFAHSYDRHDSWDNGSNPIQYSCQKSFAVLVTDGRPQQDRDMSSYLCDYDGDSGGSCATHDMKATRQYESAGSDYLDDVAMALNEMDLRPDLVDPLGAKNNMSTYLVSFADDQAINDPLMDSAAAQGGGEKYNAGDEAELSAAFAQAIASIVQRTASASSASVNSGSISSETRVYQAKFNSATWTGQLLSFPVNTDGTLVTSGPSVWDARNELPTNHDDRKIITVNSDGTGVAFRWTAATGGTEIDATRKTQLDNNAALLSYLRGDPSNEGNLASNFRRRIDADGPNKLGDIISSAPLFIGRPPFRYRDSLEAKPYSTFAATTRRGMVYVGANDGMLHGFDASTGDEVFAFIPSPVFSRLKTLATRTYSHQFYVDGSPSMGDAFFGNDWHTVLVGGLNKGGRGIYALDVTNPSTLASAESGTNPDNILLWEFTEANDADLGLTYSQPAIVKLQDGTWAAVFGNGYNSPNGKAVLYIVNIANGNIIRKFDTGTLTVPTGVTWDNGMSTPALVDVNGDRKVDYAYAGDLFGNMWKFDLTASSSSGWNIAFSGSPLYVARDAAVGGNGQPITVQPEVGRGPQGAGTIVLFGTGKYMELADKSTTPVRRQTFYGIVDRGVSPVGDRSLLREQQITNEIYDVDPDGTGPITERINVRVSTTNTLGTTRGWFMDLVSPTLGYQAEKQVTTPIVRDGKIVFTTLIPNPDPCGAGGTSWLMELDMLSGARLANAPFDINRDGVFNAADMVTLTSGERVHLSGIQWPTAGILQSPGVIEGETGSGSGGSCIQYKYMPDSAGNIQRVNESCGPGGLGRQSWRQIR